MITSRILLRSTKRQLVTLLLLLLRLVFLFLHLVLLSVTTTHTVQKCFLLTCFKLNVITSVLTLTNVLTVLVTSTTAGTKNNNQINFDLTTGIYSRSFFILNFLTRK